MTSDNKTTNSRPRAAATRRKRKPAKRRIRKDRLALVLSVFGAFIVLIMFIISRACSDGGVVRPAEITMPEPEVITAAHHDARAVETTLSGSMERQKALFEVHVRYSKLRDNGYIHAAEQYKNEVAAYLDSRGIKLQ